MLGGFVFQQKDKYELGWTRLKINSECPRVGTLPACDRLNLIRDVEYLCNLEMHELMLVSAAGRRYVAVLHSQAILRAQAEQLV